MAIDAARASAAEALSREQFDLFYRATAPALRSYICRVSGNSATADDTLQEAYIRLLNVSLVPEARKSYLYRTATNLIIDQRRAQACRERWTWLVGRRAEGTESRVEIASDMDRRSRSSGIASGRCCGSRTSTEPIIRKSPRSWVSSPAASRCCCFGLAVKWNQY
jgi:DNA-directed RNA polymerase specialized sigma24 family protein